MTFSFGAISAESSKDVSDEEPVIEESDVAPDDSVEDEADEYAEDEDVEEEDTEDDAEYTMLTDSAVVDSPLKQIANGVPPHEIQCGKGLQLIFKANDFKPACVKESTYEILLQWGWASDHDPSHGGLMTKDKMSESMEEESDMSEESNTNSTSEDNMPTGKE